MQKLSYRDQVIVTIFLAILIGVAGYMLLIKPKYEKIQSTKSSLSAAQEEWNDLEYKISQIDSIKERIQNKYDECVQLGNFFVEVKRANTLEKFIQTYIDKNNIFVKTNVSLTEPEITTLAPYTRGSKSLDYSIGNSAVLDVPQDTGEEEEQQTDSSFIPSQNLPFGTTTIDFTATRGDLIQFMQDIRDSGKTIEIKSLSISSGTYSMEPTAEMTGNLVIDVYYADMISDLDIAAEIAESEKGE